MKQFAKVLTAWRVSSRAPVQPEASLYHPPPSTENSTVPPDVWPFWLVSELRSLGPSETPGASKPKAQSLETLPDPSQNPSEVGGGDVGRSLPLLGPLPSAAGLGGSHGHIIRDDDGGDQLLYLLSTYYVPGPALCGSLLSETQSVLPRAP